MKLLKNSARVLRAFGLPIFLALAITGCGGGSAGGTTASPTSPTGTAPTEVMPYPVVTASQISGASTSAVTDVSEATIGVSVVAAATSDIGKLAVNQIFITGGDTNHIPVAWKVASRTQSAGGNVTIQLVRPPMADVIASVDMKYDQNLTVDALIPATLPLGTIIVNDRVAKVVNAAGLFAEVPLASAEKIRAEVLKGVQAERLFAGTTAISPGNEAFFKQLLSASFKNSSTATENSFCVLVPSEANQDFSAFGGGTTLKIYSSLCLKGLKASGETTGSVARSGQLGIKVSAEGKIQTTIGIEVENFEFSTVNAPRSIAEQGFSSRNLEAFNYDVRLQGVGLPPNKAVLANLVFRTANGVAWRPTVGVGTTPNITQTPGAIVVLVLGEIDLKANFKAYARFTSTFSVSASVDAKINFDSSGVPKQPVVSASGGASSAEPLAQMGLDIPGQGQPANRPILSNRLGVELWVAPAALGYIPFNLSFSNSGIIKVQPQKTTNATNAFVDDLYTGTNCINYALYAAGSGVWQFHARAIVGPSNNPTFDEFVYRLGEIYTKVFFDSPNRPIPLINYGSSSAFTPVTTSQSANGATVITDCLGRPTTGPVWQIKTVSPSQATRTLPTLFYVTGANLPTASLVVTVPSDPRGVCESPTNRTDFGFNVRCTVYKLGGQTLEVRNGTVLLGSTTFNATSNVTGVSWTSPSTNNSGAVKFNENVTFSVAGVNLLADPTMGFAIEKCGVSNSEIAVPSNTVRTFTCFFNDQAGAVAGVMPGVVKDAPSGQVLFSGWSVPVAIMASSATGRINDTGISSSGCFSAPGGFFVSCTSAGAIELNSRQDGMVGRDVTSPDPTDGKLGFSFSAIAGYPLTDCVKDNVTGLTWEGKTVTGSRAGVNRYTNYDNTSERQHFNGGLYVNATLEQINAETNSVGYKNFVNSIALCGYTDWRLPSAEELQGIVDYGVGTPGPTIDINWFPNTVGETYWSASSAGAGKDLDGYRFSVYFNYGFVSLTIGSRQSVRLVR